ncbi:MAG: hypothetical protein IJP71_00800 [Lachnospiraceae bacterium]|nr:hypothetical protein [Lachnospiraceae bacterium]
MNNGKKHMVWLTLDEIEKVKEILPDVEYQLLYGRRAYRRKYYEDHAFELREKAKEYRKKKKRQENRLKKEKVKKIKRKK